MANNPAWILKLPDKREKWGVDTPSAVRRFLRRFAGRRQEEIDPGAWTEPNRERVAAHCADASTCGRFPECSACALKSQCAFGRCGPRIHQLPEAERPRERLIARGAAVLSDTELLALMIHSGQGEDSALSLASRVVSQLGPLETLRHTSVQELTGIRGIGPAKAARILAAIELATRFERHRLNPGTKYRCSDDVFQYYRLSMGELPQESFRVVYLDCRGRVQSEQELFRGTLTTTVIHPREIFAEAIRRRAASIVVVHNHPSGAPEPSEDDFRVTRRLVEVANLVEIQLTDHIIIGRDRYFSFADADLLPSLNRDSASIA